MNPNGFESLETERHSGERKWPEMEVGAFVAARVIRLRHVDIHHQGERPRADGQQGLRGRLDQVGVIGQHRRSPHSHLNEVETVVRRHSDRR